jgi:hypothetical protein
MKDLMDHERKRFQEMTTGQLLTRLNKITKTDKLRSFIKAAEVFGYPALARAAERRLSSLGNKTIKESLDTDRRRYDARKLSDGKPLRKTSRTLQDMANKRRDLRPGEYPPFIPQKKPDKPKPQEGHLKRALDF